MRLALNHCILVAKKPSVAQPHILNQVCCVYECEAGLESLHIGGKKAFSGLASHSKSSLWCVRVIHVRMRGWP